MGNDSQKTRSTVSITLIAIVAALALLGVVAITVVTIPLQQAEANCITGYIHSGNKSALFTAFEKSNGRCL